MRSSGIKVLAPMLAHRVAKKEEEMTTMRLQQPHLKNLTMLMSEINVHTGSGRHQEKPNSRRRPTSHWECEQHTSTASGAWSQHARSTGSRT